MIYADIVKKALQELGPSNLATRRRLYDQLKGGLEAALDECVPPLDGREKTIELRLLETTVRRFETDLRAGVDVTVDAYVPEGLEAEQLRLYALKVVARAPSSPTGTAEADENRSCVAALSEQMQRLSLSVAAKGYRESALRPAILGALLLRAVRDMVSSQGRFGLFWIFLEPILLIGATVAIYLAFDQRFVMNMDLIPFTILGVVAWLLIRMTAVKVAASSVVGRELLALPPIRVVSIAIGQALAQLLLYTVAMIFALWLAMALGHGELPENWVRLTVFWILLWVFGLAAGLTMAPSFILTKAAGRLSLIGTRFISWTSGLAFVSEQFPSELKGYFLWNPILHGMQLLRSAHFSQYETEDGSLFYFLSSIGVMLIMAAASERVLAPRVEPA